MISFASILLNCKSTIRKGKVANAHIVNVISIVFQIIQLLIIMMLVKFIPRFDLAYGSTREFKSSSKCHADVILHRIIDYKNKRVMPYVIDC